MKGGNILDFYMGGNLRKGGIDLEKGVYDSPYQICMIFKNTFVEEYLQTTTYAFFKLIFWSSCKKTHSKKKLQKLIKKYENTFIWTLHAAMKKYITEMCH